MAIAFRDAAANNVALSVSPQVTAPAGLTDGDFIIVAISTDSLHDHDSILAGWTAIGPIDAGTDNSLTILYKFASSEGASWTFTDLFANKEYGVAGVVCYSGVDSTTPLDVSSVTGLVVWDTPPAGPITPTNNGCMIVSVFGADPGVDTRNATAGDDPECTERVDICNGTIGYVFMQDFLQVTADEVSCSMTADASDAFAWVIMALRPAATSGISIPVVMHHLSMLRQ
jgi:hypothetical protein